MHRHGLIFEANIDEERKSKNYTWFTFTYDTLKNYPAHRFYARFLVHHNLANKTLQEHMRTHLRFLKYEH